MGGFLYYRKSNKEFIGKSGYPVLGHVAGSLMLEKEVLPKFGGTIEDYGFIQIDDAEMARCYNAGSVEITDRGYIIHEKVTLTCPTTTTVNTSVDISTDYEAILYIDGVQQTTGTTWQVIFETAGTYLVEVDAGRHGKVSREVVVE